jgi:hypothetical protein
MNVHNFGQFKEIVKIYKPGKMSSTQVHTCISVCNKAGIEDNLPTFSLHDNYSLIQTKSLIYTGLTCDKQNLCIQT